ncbi:hypothetical protein Tco_0452399 [Tanacetum coccineum]
MFATKVEYIAASEAAMEAVWIRKFILGLGSQTARNGVGVILRACLKDKVVHVPLYDAVKDSLGVAIKTLKTHMARMESWWLCEKVQSKVTVKQARFKELLPCQECNQEEHIKAHERISHTEVRTALQKMGIKKAVRPDQIPIEAWKSLGEEDLEKAYDSVPRELIWKTLIDKRASRRYIKVIRDMYDGVETRSQESVVSLYIPPLLSTPMFPTHSKQAMALEERPIEGGAGDQGGHAKTKEHKQEGRADG